MATTKTKYRRTSKGKFVGQKGLLDRIATVEKTLTRVELPEFRAGDTLKVHVRIKEGEKERIQIYEGTVIRRGNHTGGKSFTVRKISHGVGAERIFLETSPKIAKIEVVQQGKVRRAKLYYLRGLEGKAARIRRDVEGMAATRAKEKAAAAAAAAADSSSS